MLQRQHLDLCFRPELVFGVLVDHEEIPLGLKGEHTF